MAQSNAEIAKDMVVALLGCVREIAPGMLQDNSTQLGKAIAEIYREVLSEVRKIPPPRKPTG